MADPSITAAGPISTLLRAQTTADLQALNNSQQVTQKQNNLQANGARPTTVQQPPRIVGASNGNVPRGSLFDVLV